MPYFDFEIFELLKVRHFMDVAIETYETLSIAFMKQRIPFVNACVFDTAGVCNSSDIFFIGRGWRSAAGRAMKNPSD